MTAPIGGASRRYVAFLRAVNVGGHTVRMDRLRALFEELDLGDVATFIASGNVIFDAPAGDAAALERRIERHLERALGYEVATFLRTPEELATIAAHPAFPASSDDGAAGTLSIAFLKAPPAEAATRAVMAYRTAHDDFHVRERELYWLCRTRTSDSAFSGAALEKALRAPATLRNITTVRKLVAKYGG